MATKKAEQADDAKEEEEEHEEVAPDKGDSGGSSALDGLEGHIRDLVKQAVETLVGDGTKGKHTSVDDEERLARLVRDAQAKIKAEEEKENRFKSVEETLKKVTEKPPSRDGLGGKIQKWLWGEN